PSFCCCCQAAGVVPPESAGRALPPALRTQTGSPELSSAQSSRSFPPKRCQKLFHSRPPPRARAAQGDHNRLRFAARAFHILIYHAKIVILAKLRDFVAGLAKPPRNFFFRLLP